MEFSQDSGMSTT